MAELRKLINRRGATIETPYGDQEALELLNGHIQEGEIVGDFPTKLCRSSRGAAYNLSDEQMWWVHKIVVQHRNPTPIERHYIGDMTGIVNLFKTAKQHYKFPKVRLQLVQGPDQPIIPFSLQIGKFGALAGLIIVSPEHGQMWGIIKEDGTFEKSGRSRQDLPDGLIDYLQEFAKNPAYEASMYGRLTSNCSFCGLELTDIRSVTVGYGPICAGHYGLPWGDEVVEMFNQIQKMKELADKLKGEQIA